MALSRLCLIFLFAFAPIHLLGSALVVSVNHGLVIEDQGERKLGKEGAILKEPSWLETSAKGYGELKFSDGTKMTLFPSTKIRVLAYAFGRLKTPQMILEIEKGEIEFKSGSTGVQNPKQFKIITSEGVLGIRGSAGRLIQNEDFVAIKPLPGHRLSFAPYHGEKVYLTDASLFSTFDRFGKVFNLSAFAGQSLSRGATSLGSMLATLSPMNMAGVLQIPFLPKRHNPAEIIFVSGGITMRRHKKLENLEGFREISLEKERPNLKKDLGNKLYLGKKEIRIFKGNSRELSHLFLNAIEKEAPNPKAILELKGKRLTEGKGKQIFDFVLEKREPYC